MSSALKYCPKCKKTFESEERFCPEDGAQLQEQRRPGDPLIGRLVAGKYRILDKLGVGGFGSVYRCEDLRFESICAIKILDQHRLEELKAVNAGERFIREARLLKRLSDSSRHADTLKHIVQVLDVDEDHDEGLLYFTMDFVEGRHLLDVLQDKGGPLAVDRTIRVARQACKALNLAHPEIVHRDLKPENLMLTEVETGEGIEEIVKILDFGIAKVEGDKRLTQGPAAAMSPGYVAPEQVQRRADYRADLFSLGVILYELLTFHSPWSGRKISDPPDEDWFGLIEKSRTIEPKPITEYNELVPQELEQIVLKLVAKDPEKRYQSAKDLDGALARIEELLEQSRPGSVRVIAGMDGVEVVLRSGRKKIHASTTPATFKGVEPGRYHVRIEDRRYKRESGVVEVHPGAQATVQLRASPRPERPPIGEYLARYKKQLQMGGAALAVLIVASLAFSALKAPPLMSESAFDDVMGRGLVEAMEVRSGELWIELTESVDGSDEHRILMAGMALQSLTRELRNAGLEIEGRGEGRVTVASRASFDGSTVSGLAPAIESLCQGCASPSEGPAGWYSVDFSDEGWDLDSTTVEDTVFVFGETLGGLAPSFFLPGDHSLELNLWLTQTELGAMASRVEEALAAGRLDEGDDESALALVADFARQFPDSRTLGSLNEQVAGAYFDRARAAGSDTDAEQIAGECLAFSPTYAPCSSLIDSIQTSRRLAQEAADRAAQEEADRIAQAAADRARRETEQSREEPEQTRVVSSPPPEERRPDLQPTQPVRQDPSTAQPDPEPEAREQETEQAPTSNPPTGRANPFGNDPAADPGPAVEEQPEEQPAEEDPTPPAPPSISRIAIGSWTVAERGEDGLQVSLQLGIQNAPSAGWCAAVRVLDENGEAIEDRNGDQQLGGQVAMLTDFTPSSGPQEIRLGLPLPDGLDRSVRAMIGETQLQIRAAVWPNSCSAVGTSAPEAESAASDVCFAMAGNQSFRPCQ